MSLKIGFITSKGGHLTQILQINKLYIKSCPKFWVTFKGEDTALYLKKEKVYFAFFPESRSYINLIKNFFLALHIIKKEAPNILISSGAGIAIPFFVIGKILKIKLIYIEPFDFVAYPSLTGKIVYKLADLFLVQHTVQQKWYPNAKHWGNLM